MRYIRLVLLATAIGLISVSTAAISQVAVEPVSASAAAALSRTIVTGDSWILDKTIALRSLKVEPGAAIAAVPGSSLTMTVDGVETTILPGLYRGEIVLSVTDQHTVKFSETLTHHFRQALYLDQNGVVNAKSVLAAAGPYTLKNGVLTGMRIKSVGENFNGIVVAGGTYTLKDLVLNFEGNGGNDFAGYGAGVMSDGKNTTLILDGAKVATHGAVRTTVVGNNGSNLVVKNSDISARTGVLPSDYVSNVMPGEMKDAPWMLGIKGNVRATNVLGDNTTCTYINSNIESDGWGVLSIDASQNTRLTAINSKLNLRGVNGYGSYAIGNSTNAFYGTVMNVPTYGMIITGGHAVFASSKRATVARLNADLKLGLTAAELAALEPTQTIVNSERFGVMMWGDATVAITDGTVFNTGEAVFLDKGATAVIDVDGSQGARLNSKNGIIFQAIDNDDPGPDMTDGRMANTGVFHESRTAPAKVQDFDLGAVHKTDMVAKFSKIKLQGDFYNAIRSLSIGSGFTLDGSRATPPVVTGANLVLSFNASQLTGVISAATATHVKDSITAANFEMLGVVTNTPSPAINNGVIVSLTGSTWTVQATSYLTSLTIGPGAKVIAPRGQSLTMSVNGVTTPIRAGAYRGEIVLQVGPGTRPRS